MIGRNSEMVDSSGFIRSSFINKIIRKNVTPEPIVVNIPTRFDLEAVKQEMQQSAAEKFESQLKNIHQLNLLKQSSNFVILDPKKNEGFMQNLLSFLEVQGHTPTEPKYSTKTGIKVRTKAEKMCADFYTDIGLPYVYEPIIVFIGKKRNFFKMPDFYFPDADLIHEHFGLANNGQYAADMKKKKDLYDSFLINWFYTFPEDEENIEQILTRKLIEKEVVKYS